MLNHKEAEQEIAKMVQETKMKEAGILNSIILTEISTETTEMIVEEEVTLRIVVILLTKTEGTKQKGVTLIVETETLEETRIETILETEKTKIDQISEEITLRMEGRTDSLRKITTGKTI